MPVHRTVMPQHKGRKRQRSSGHHSNECPVSKTMSNLTTPEKSQDMATHLEIDSRDKKVDFTTISEGNKSQDDKIDYICKMAALIPCIQSDVKDIRGELHEHSKSIQWATEEIEELKKSKQKDDEDKQYLMSEVEKMKIKAAKQEEEIQKLSEQVVNLDAYSRRDNLIFYNIPEQSNEKCVDVINNIMSECFEREDIKFVRVHRLGGKTGRSRPIIARFHFYPDRDYIWRNRHLLRNTPTVVKEDLPEPMRKAQDKLFPVYKRAKFDGSKAKLVKSSIMIDGKLYDSTSLPDKYNPRNVCERDVEIDGKGYILFAGEGSPLSNFYNSSFELQGKRFVSNEQCIAYHQAIYAKQEAKANKIMQLTNPREIKRVSSEFKINKKDWLRHEGIEKMKEGLRAKFCQNSALRNILVSTAPKVLVECTRDPTWACGHTLFTKEAAEPDKWQGKNLLGDILAEIRQELR